MGISRLSICKFLELAISCILVAIHYHSFPDPAEINMLVTGTFVGFLIIFGGAALGYSLQTPMHKRVDMFYSLVGCILFVASGAVLIDKHQYDNSSDLRDKHLAKGSLAIINGGLLLIDTVLTQFGD